MTFSLALKTNILKQPIESSHEYHRDGGTSYVSPVLGFVDLWTFPPLDRFQLSSVWENAVACWFSVRTLTSCCREWDDLMKDFLWRRNASCSVVALSCEVSGQWQDKGQMNVYSVKRTIIVRQYFLKKQHSYEADIINDTILYHLNL